MSVSAGTAADSDARSAGGSARALSEAGSAAKASSSSVRPASTAAAGPPARQDSASRVSGDGGAEPKEGWDAAVKAEGTASGSAASDPAKRGSGGERGVSSERDAASSAESTAPPPPERISVTPSLCVSASPVLQSAAPSERAAAAATGGGSSSSSSSAAASRVRQLEERCRMLEAECAAQRESERLRQCNLEAQRWASPPRMWRLGQQRECVRPSVEFSAGFVELSNAASSEYCALLTSVRRQNPRLLRVLCADRPTRTLEVLSLPPAEADERLNFVENCWTAALCGDPSASGRDVSEVVAWLAPLRARCALDRRKGRQ